MAKFQQVGWKPADVEIRPVEEAAVGRRDEPHVRRGKDRSPRNFRSEQRWRARPSVLQRAANVREFFGIDARLILRAIAVEEKEHQRPDDAQQGENVEDPAPAPCVHDDDGKRRRDHHRKAAETMGYTLDEAALGFWKPKLHRAACRWKGAGFAQTKGEADREERSRA